MKDILARTEDFQSLLIRSGVESRGSGLLSILRHLIYWGTVVHDTNASWRPRADMENDRQIWWSRSRLSYYFRSTTARTGWVAK